MDTRSARRDITPYRKIQQDGVELFLLPNLAKHTTSMTIDCNKFLFLRHLKAELELENGLVSGRRASWT